MPPKSIIDQLRKAVIDCGESELSIATATGISQPQLNRFVRAERGLSLENAARLAAYLRLTLVAREK